MATANNQLTDKRFYGKVCQLHIELDGLRLKSGYQCIGCNRERTLIKVKNKLLIDHDLVMRSRVNSAIHRGKDPSLVTQAPYHVQGDHVLTPARCYGKICKKHQQLNGLRYKLTMRCCQCIRINAIRYKNKKIIGDNTNESNK